MDILLLMFVVLLYFLPWMIAAGRHHQQRSAILVLNLLLGWTALGWIIAMIWSASAIPAAAHGTAANEGHPAVQTPQVGRGLSHDRRRDDPYSSVLRRIPRLSPTRDDRESVNS
jgi:hypothetical protein